MEVLVVVKFFCSTEHLGVDRSFQNSLAGHPLRASILWQQRQV